ncbi:MAG: diguanylate cyclase domain-containing protein [Solirubrobacteraceae bacterium]
MGSLTPGDPSVDATKGAIEGQRKFVPSPSRMLGDDQTLADRDQTLEDADQTTADSDQTAADSDQAAAESDQAASDRDLVHGGDPSVHRFTRDLRDRSAQQRQQGAQRRVDAAGDRDQIASARDLAAQARDQAAELRDRELAARDAAAAGDGRAMTAEEIGGRASADRGRAAADRSAAAEGRARAASDREHAADDRAQADRDRFGARADRDALLTQLAILETDQLTGARTRGAGLLDVDNEIDRALRTTGRLAIAYVDIVGLKVINDTHGHAAGDALLQHAVRGIRHHLRSYDLIVRVGGDEFVCVLPDATIEDARQRFGAIQTGLAADPERCEIKVGFAELAKGDSTADLIQRADDELPTSPGR